MADQAPVDWTTYIITTLITALGSVVGAIVFLAKIIENRYVEEIKALKLLFINSEISHNAEMLVQKAEILEGKADAAKCQKEREELAIRVARLESVSDNLKKLARSSEMKSIDRADLIKARLEELESK